MVDHIVLTRAKARTRVEAKGISETGAKSSVNLKRGVRCDKQIQAVHVVIPILVKI